MSKHRSPAGGCIHGVPLGQYCDECRDWHPIADAMRDPGDRDGLTPVPGIRRCECGEELAASGVARGERSCATACAEGETTEW